jgi:hypothetical protein
MSTKRLKCYVLATGLHPLLNAPDVFSLLNDAYEKKRKISFGYVEYANSLEAGLKY